MTALDDMLAKADEVLALDEKATPGPTISTKISCFGCPHQQSVGYRVQSDSGRDVYCHHPDNGVEPRHVGDTTWDTPDWCPVHPGKALAAAPDLARALRAVAEALEELRGTLEGERAMHRIRAAIERRLVKP